MTIPSTVEVAGSPAIPAVRGRWVTDPREFPALGAGIGLRAPHYPAIEAGLSSGGRSDTALTEIDWFEALSDNYLAPGGRPRSVLHKAREHFPIVLHGVGMSLGSTDPLDEEYLRRLAALIDEIEPAMVSDHLAWSGVGGRFGHDLYPLPMTEQAVRHVAERIARVQDRLGRRILVENISSYAELATSTLDEADFVAAVVDLADCGLLLDVNNVFVSAHNHGFDPRAYILRMPRGRVGQIHLAGHSKRGEMLLDTHDQPVRDEVWELYRLAVETHGAAATLIEWDDHVPSLARVAQEAAQARAVAAECVRPASSARADARAGAPDRERWLTCAS